MIASQVFPRGVSAISSNISSSRADFLFREVNVLERLVKQFLKVLFVGHGRLRPRP
jgi:hypothetical protein